MPLQKLPPNGPLSVSASVNHRPQLQNRRRTLQTISELSSTTNEGLPDFVSSIGTENIRRVANDNVPGVSRTALEPIKRQSLPQHHSSSNVQLPRPTIIATPAYRQQPIPSQPMQGRRPMPTTTEQVEGWNAKRERARMRQELAITEARQRRSTSEQGAEIAMSDVRPNAKSHPKSIRPTTHQQLPLKISSSGSCLSGKVERRASLESNNNNASQYGARPEASERASTDSSSYQSHDSAVIRSKSGSSNTSYTSQDAPPLPHGTNEEMEGYCAKLILQNHNLVSFGESARSKQLNPNRSSRTYSLPTNSFKHMNAQRHRYATAPDLHQLPKQQQSPQISAQRARNQALAALTAANSHMRTNPGSQYPTLTYPSLHQNRHAGLTSHPPNSSARQNSASPHRNSLRYHAQLEVQRRITSPSPAHMNDYMNRTSQHRHSDQPRRVSFETRTVPKRESLTQWKKEREEAKTNLHLENKARMQERVRRANELEQEKEKELMSMGKRPAKAESRRCFGGLFAVLRGKGN